MNPVLQAATAKRAALQTRLDELLVAPTAEARSLEDTEAAEFEALSSDINKLDAQIASLEAASKREAAAALASLAVAPAAVVRSESMSYDKHGKNSYMRDMATLAVAARRLGGGADAGEALERLQEHNRQMDAAARSDKDVAARLNEFRQTPAGLEQRVNPNTTDGTGGEFVPPLWLVNQYIPFLRPGRVFANRVRNMPLPPGTDSINLPTITTGSSTAIQATQASGVSSTDMVTSSVSATVNTIAGQEDISLQLLEQSPLSMDGVIFEDLSRDYDQRLDLQVISGTGLNGQHKGVLSTTGVNAVTVSSAVFFDGSTSATQYRSIVKGVNSIETLRFAAPTAIWVHPRRANSWGYAADAATGRPLFIPSKYGAFNTLGLNESDPQFQGVAGELYGLPVVKDANMSTTMNGTAVTGGTADAVVVLKEDDIYLWEGALRLRALPEILSGTLQIRFQLYCYSAFMANRFAAAISVLTSNTGLAAPGF
jgi:HK97 family phage major capsid protein